MKMAVRVVFVFLCFSTVSYSMSSGDWAPSAGVPSSFHHHDEGDNYYTTAYINITFVDPYTGRTIREKTEIGKFGESYIGVSSGILVHVRSGADNSGCTLPFRSTAGSGQLPNEPWIALVKRGGCNFQVKVDNAYTSNASGIIIYNDRDSSLLEKMKLTLRPKRRPLGAVFTYKWKGEQLAVLADNGTRVQTEVTVAHHCSVRTSINRGQSEEGGKFGFMVKIGGQGEYVGRDTMRWRTCTRVAEVEDRRWGTEGEMEGDMVYRYKPGPLMESVCGISMPYQQCAILTSVLFVSISFVVLMLISLAWLVFYYVQRFRYIHAKDRLSGQNSSRPEASPASNFTIIDFRIVNRRLCSAAKKALSKIPTKHIKLGDKEVQGDGECCAICIEPYRTTEVVRILPCRHEFHRGCIDPWLVEHRTCPMCKMDILKHYGFVFTGSQESILHMDIEEVVSESESLHHHPVSSRSRSLSPSPRPLSQFQIGLDFPSHADQLSRSSSPDELTPSLAPLGGGMSRPQTSIGCSEVLTVPGSALRRSLSLDNCSQ